MPNGAAQTGASRNRIRLEQQAANPGRTAVYRQCPSITVTAVRSPAAWPTCSCDVATEHAIECIQICGAIYCAAISISTIWSPAGFAPTTSAACACVVQKTTFESNNGPSAQIARLRLRHRHNCHLSRFHPRRGSSRRRSSQGLTTRNSKSPHLLLVHRMHYPAHPRRVPGCPWTRSRRKTRLRPS